MIGCVAGAHRVASRRAAHVRARGRAARCRALRRLGSGADDGADPASHTCCEWPTSFIAARATMQDPDGPPHLRDRAGRRQDCWWARSALATSVGRRSIRLGYWIGRPYWGNGYATRGGAPSSRSRFSQPRHRQRCTRSISCANPASGRVMAKCGMSEASARRCVRIAAAGEEFLVWSIDRDAWERGDGRPG